LLSGERSALEGLSERSSSSTYRCILLDPRTCRCAAWTICSGGSSPIVLAPGFTRQRAVSCVSGSQVSLVGWHSSLRHAVFHPEEVAATALLRELKLVVCAVAEALGVQLNRPAGQGRLGRRRPRWAWGRPQSRDWLFMRTADPALVQPKALAVVAFQHWGHCRHGTRRASLASVFGDGGRRPLLHLRLRLGWGGAPVALGTPAPGLRGMRQQPQNPRTCLRHPQQYPSHTPTSCHLSGSIGVRCRHLRPQNAPRPAYEGLAGQERLI
jgi:hypothetical protein